MPFDIASIGAQAATDVIGSGLGIALGNYNDERQVSQQHRLTDIQIDAQKNLTDYNYNKQMQMWEATNYPAQMAQLQKAGLNPALLYAKGGQGGMTNVATGSASSGQAQQNPGEVQQMMGMGIQQQLVAAQTDLMKAQADKTRAEIPNVPKAGQLIDAQTQNTQQQTALAKVNTDIQEISRYIQGQTANLTIDQIIQLTRKITQDADRNEIALFVDRATQLSVVDRIKAEGIGAVLHNALMESDTQLNEQQIRESAQSILQKWRQIELQGRTVTVQEGELILDQEMQKYNLKPSWKKALNSVIGGVSNITHVAGTIGAQMIK